jgi:intergrase/recombinase
MHPLINGNLIKNRQKEKRTELLRLFSNFNHRQGIGKDEEKKKFKNQRSSW